MLYLASFDGEKHSVHLPPVNSASFVLRFLEKLCHSLQCDNLFSSQPFSPYMGSLHGPADYDRNKACKNPLSGGKYFFLFFLFFIFIFFTKNIGVSTKCH